MMQDLRILWTDGSIAISAVVILTVSVLAFLSWKISGFRRGVGAVEVLRLLLVIALLFTLNQPEWVTQVKPEERPVVGVFWDASKSMDTRDVVSADDPEARAITRAQWLESRIDPERWSDLGADVEVVIEPFSAAESASEDGMASEPGTDLSSPLESALDRFPNLRAVVLMSDGDWNAGAAPLEVATRYRTRKIPIFTTTVGSPSALPDLEVLSLEPPAIAVTGKLLQIPFSIRSSMPRDVEVELNLSGDDGSVETKRVRIPAKGLLEDFIDWRAPRPGRVSLTLGLPRQSGELEADNNAKTVDVEIREESLKILLIESYPRWEYRYLRNALVRDPGVEVSCLLFLPDLKHLGGGPLYLDGFPSKEELATYDVIFLGDVGVGDGQLAYEDLALIKGLVEQQASGLIFMPGYHGFQSTLLDTELGELYPVNLDPTQPHGVGSSISGAFALTEAGRRGLVTKLVADEEKNEALWEGLPGFNWFAAANGSRPGSRVLAVHRDAESEMGRVPLLVTRPFGTGKVLYMGTDAVWRWREGVEDLYHYRFWAQVARWMAYQRRMSEGESMRLFYSPDRPRSQSKITLHANVMDAGGAPLQDGRVNVRIVSPSGRTERIRMTPGAGEWGLYLGRFSPIEAGTHALTLECRETGSTLEAEIEVIGDTREKLGRPARHDVLEEIARVSRGEARADQRIDRIVERIRGLPEPPPVSTRVRLWSHPAWASILVALMAGLWIGRKMIGRI